MQPISPLATPPLNPQHGDAAPAAWKALTALRQNLADTGHGPALPLTGAMYVRPAL